MTTLLIPDVAVSIATDKIDFQLAESILDRLGYTLRDFSLEYGDMAVADGDISHELHYGSHYNTHNTLGYVWIEGGLYYTATGGNHRHAELAALDLLDPQVVRNCQLAIQLDRASFPDYM